MPLSAGARLGAYEIIGPLGAGGMGEVYRALDSSLGRDVAIKVLPEGVAHHPERLARFEREARLLASLSHPNIAVVHGLERSAGSYYLVMELVKGETLAERSARGVLPLQETLDIFKQIAEGLEAAHGQSIIHRDLKPANIMVTPTGTVKILDFGLAKVVSPEDSGFLSQSPTLSSSPTMAGIVMGTAAYMSPEQARGDPVDRRTDIWAFGCLLFEAVTGRRAFPGRTTSDTIATVLREDPDWSKATALAPPKLQLLIRRCLQKNPHVRLHDIADARIEIDDIAREPMAPAGETGLVDGPRRLLATPSTIGALATAAVVLVALGAVAGVTWWPARLAPPESSSARVMITLPSPQALEKGRFPPVALSPDGRLLVYAAATDGGRTNLFLRPLDELSARPIPETEGASTPFFSPDGRWLAFYADGLLKKVSVAGGVPLTISDAPPVWSATWGENDRIVFATTLAPSGLWEVSANGGAPTQITTPEPDEAQHGYPQLLPGGRQMLFSVRRGNAWHLALLALDSREWAVLGNGRVIGEGAQYLPTGHLVYTQSGGLVATPFDPSSGNLDQPPVSLLERVETSRFGGAYFAVAARSGTLVYVPAGTTVADRALMRVDRDGRVAPAIETRGGYEYPAFSPDGRQAAVMMATGTGSDIWIIDLERATRTRFTADGTSAFPVWAPDGSRVAFQSTAPGLRNLFWKPLDGSSDAQPFLNAADSAGALTWPNIGTDLLPGTLPTLSGAGPQFPTSWSPDGSLAFHERKPSGERDIWVVTAGSDPVPFLRTPFDERSPRFSPDGTWLAYVSDESGRNDVYVQPFPGPGPKWLVSTDGGVDPVWSRDSRELFYRRDDQMMTVPVAPRGEFSVGRPRRLFEMRFDAGDNGPNYDVSRDGTWFLMPRSEQGPAAGELHLVLNWFNVVAARARPESAHRSSSESQQVMTFWRSVFPALLAAGLPQAPPLPAEAGVRDMLQRYSTALESLDANAVKKVQPSIPTDNLARAFKEMRELRVAIDAVRVLSIDGTTARVSCRVTQTLTPRVGSRQTTTVTRVMRLRRAVDSSVSPSAEVWVIDGFER